MSTFLAEWCTHHPTKCIKHVQALHMAIAKIIKYNVMQLVGEAQS